MDSMSNPRLIEYTFGRKGARKFSSCLRNLTSIRNVLTYLNCAFYGIEIHFKILILLDAVDAVDPVKTGDGSLDLENTTCR